MNHSNIIDRILADVCLDERVSDGIFRIEESAHMEAFRDYLCEHGFTTNDAIEWSNKILEGKYPERQAYRKEDGLLITWPSPEYKKNAMEKNPGKYVDEKPTQDNQSSTKQPLPNDEKIPQSAPSEPSPEETETDIDKQLKAHHLFNTSVDQNGKQLAVEPIGSVKSEPDQVASKPTQEPQVPSTPQQKIATKIMATQILGGDNVEMGGKPVETPLTEHATSNKYMIFEMIMAMTPEQIEDVYNTLKSKYSSPKK